MSYDSQFFFDIQLQKKLGQPFRITPPQLRETTKTYLEKKILPIRRKKAISRTQVKTVPIKNNLFIYLLIFFFFKSSTKFKLLDNFLLFFEHTKIIFKKIYHQSLWNCCTTNKINMFPGRHTSWSPGHRRKLS
jgi:hypothetical protein